MTTVISWHMYLIIDCSIAGQLAYVSKSPIAQIPVKSKRYETMMEDEENHVYRISMMSRSIARNTIARSTIVTYSSGIPGILIILHASSKLCTLIIK